jgi:hypothetical protein
VASDSAHFETRCASASSSSWLRPGENRARSGPKYELGLAALPLMIHYIPNCGIREPFECCPTSSRKENLLFINSMRIVN